MNFIFFWNFILHAKDVKYVNTSIELFNALNYSKNGDTIILKSGVYVGSFFIKKSLNLLGDGFVLLTSNRSYNVLNISSNKVTIKNIIIYNSGRKIDKDTSDSCIYVNRGSSNIKILDNFFTECGFGIWLDDSSYNYLLKNIFVGTVIIPLAERGNTIQLYRNDNTVISDNFIINGRDGVFISNSKEVSINENIFINARFGIHYMFSHKCSVLSNMVSDSLLGIAIMYSKYVDLMNNYSYLNTNHGLFFIEAVYSRMLENKSLYNINGISLGGSYYNDIVNNDVIKNNVGIKASNVRNENLVYKNNFISNMLQIQFLYSNTTVWNYKKTGNFWSHYLGWDLNSDDIGDKKFYVTNISDMLVYSYPVLRVMFNSPALVLLQKIENQFPSFRMSSVIDNYPLMRPVIW
ncbi:MAG TPA: nitrous oxide reductase family maturation protein NosD [Candidatus Azoamicus sp. OHIO1]